MSFSFVHGNLFPSLIFFSQLSFVHSQQLSLFQFYYVHMFSSSAIFYLLPISVLLLSAVPLPRILFFSVLFHLLPVPHPLARCSSVFFLSPTVLISFLCVFTLICRFSFPVPALKYNVPFFSPCTVTLPTLLFSSTCLPFLSYCTLPSGVPPAISGPSPSLPLCSRRQCA